MDHFPKFKMGKPYCQTGGKVLHLYITNPYYPLRLQQLDHWNYFPHLESNKLLKDKYIYIVASKIMQIICSIRRQAKGSTFKICSSSSKSPW